MHVVDEDELNEQVEQRGGHRRRLLAELPASWVPIPPARQPTSMSSRRASSTSGSCGQPAVDGPGLHHGAARGGQPAEPLAEASCRGSARRPRHAATRSRPAPIAPPRGRVRRRRTAAWLHRAYPAQPRKSALWLYSTTPTLTNSSRSTRGTQRSTTYWIPGRSGHAPPPPGSQAARRPAGPADSPCNAWRISSGAGPRAGRLQPLVRHQGQHLGQQLGVTCGGQAGVHGRDQAGRPGKNVIGGVVGLAREASADGAGATPAVMEVQRRTVVDQPQLAVPDQQIRVTPAAIDVGGERVQPEHPDGLLGRHRHVGVPAERAGQEVDGQVQSDAGGEQILHLLIGLVLADGRIQFQGAQLGNPQPEPAGQLADHDLGHQHLQSLAGAAELDHVGAEVRRPRRCRAANHLHAAG